ncbi:PDZ domain-containing protein [Sphaerisporangium sp. NPDC049002]|uniref:PDZ domain-containing protein n=1 Tax=unclassified Sphaerisporangium TaxID=2630420 RepID=UPI0033E76C5E
MIHKSVKSCAAVVLGAGLLVAGATSADAAAPASRRSLAGPVRSLPPQRNVPDLDAPGPAKPVSYPPDGQTRRRPGYLTIQAPAHTRIVGLNLRCPGAVCPDTIAPDRRSATAQLRAGTWTFVRPLDVQIAADGDAPLAGGRFSGTFTLDGAVQPLTVIIKPGTQGALSAYLRNSGGTGVRVVFLDHGSATEASGLQAEDVITSFDGVRTPTITELDHALRGKRARATFPVTVIRRGAVVNLQVTLDQEG